MTRKFLQLVGALTILGVLAAGAAAAFVVKQRFLVTIAGEQAGQRAGPDPVTLLRDDVASLRHDVSSLSQVLSKNFETLATQDDAADAARRQELSTALAPLATSLASLGARMDALDASAAARAQAARDGQKQDLAQAVAALPAPSSPAAAVPPSVTPATAPPPPVVPAPTPAAAGGRRKGFLAFSLPSESLEVDRSQRFEIVASLSRVGFDAKSTLHDFTGVTSETSGTFVATLARPGSGTSGHVEAATASIVTGEDARDAELRKTLDVKRFPAIAFDLVSFEAATVDAKAVTATGAGKGRFTIHGVTLDVQIPLRISLDEGRRVVIEGETPLRMSAFGVFPPKAMGVIAVDDRINVWVSLRARAVGRAE